MLNYILRRLILLPLTLFCIVLVNFVIISLAPGDPTTITEISPEKGATMQENRSVAFGSDDRYLQFREFYGLTLPVLFNTWPWLTEQEVKTTLWRLIHKRWMPEDQEEMSVKSYNEMRVRFGDQSRFIMPILLKIIENPEEPIKIKSVASRFFYRGGNRQAYLGTQLTKEQKNYNKKIAVDNNLLSGYVISEQDSELVIEKKIEGMRKWYDENKTNYNFAPDPTEKIAMLFFDTRFFRYFSRVLRLDFGTMRNDANKTVISEVTKRFKYSLTLSIIPMFITLFLCQLFGFTMAYKQKQWQDYSLNFIFLILYAIPIFVVAPFLIEKVALNKTFPFTNIPIPISGFTSPESIYSKMTSSERLFDIIKHLILPVVAILYGGLAAESRLSRTAVLEVLRQDYVRTAKAKGVPPIPLLFKHVGRNAAITIVTSIAGSLGVVLGGSLIVETLFEINGFGKYFYDAIVNRDYNVIMFSALAGAFLTLTGYLIADIAYTLLDPRVTLD